MAEDLDVDAMLEAAFNNKHTEELSSSSSRKRDKDHHHTSRHYSSSRRDENNGTHKKSKTEADENTGDQEMEEEEEEYGPKVLRKPVPIEDDKGGRGRSRSRDRRGGSSSGRGDRRSDGSSRKSGRRSRSRERGSRRRSRSRDNKRSRSRDLVEGSKRRRSSRDRGDSGRTNRARRSHSRDAHVRRGRGVSSERVDRVRLDRGGTPPRLRLGPRRSRSPLTLSSAGTGGGTGGPDTPLSPEERDARTVFCMQLSQRIRARDLEDFFSTVGKVRDVRMITCNKTRRFKGIAYIEFREIDSVPLALGLGGQKVLGVPIIVQPSQAEKNRAGQLAKAGALAAAMATSTPGPMKLYVGSLHFNITEEMLRGIFEPFGRIDEILLMKDHETQRSKGFGFMTFHEGEDAKRAMEQLNGFEIAGRPMKVGYVTEKSDSNYFHNPQTFLDTDEMDRAGVNLGVTGRLQLMAKLAEGTDLKLPEAATTALNMQMNQQIAAQQQQQQQTTYPGHQQQPITVDPPIATQCFMLSNMFDPSQELANSRFEQDMKDEVVEACIPHGGAVHAYVDMTSPTGNVYVKCPSVTSAVAAVNALHGRWFGGRVITAAYVPLLNYHSLFPDAMTPSTTILQPSKK